MGLFHSVILYRNVDEVIVKFDRDTNIVVNDKEIKYDVPNLDYKSFDYIRTVNTRGKIRYDVYICDDGGHIIDINRTATKISATSFTFDPEIKHKMPPQVVEAMGITQNGTDEPIYGGSISLYNFRCGK